MPAILNRLPIPTVILVAVACSSSPNIFTTSEVACILKQSSPGSTSPSILTVCVNATQRVKLKYPWEYVQGLLVSDVGIPID